MRKFISRNYVTLTVYNTGLDLPIHVYLSLSIEQRYDYLTQHCVFTVNTGNYAVFFLTPM